METLFLLDVREILVLLRIMQAFKEDFEIVCYPPPFRADFHNQFAVPSGTASSLLPYFTCFITLFSFQGAVRLFEARFQSPIPWALKSNSKAVWWA